MEMALDEVLSGVDTNHRQLIVYGGKGEVLWDADVGGAVLSVAVADGRVYAGASNGYVQCFENDGTRLWRRFLAAPVIGLSPGGGCLTALGDGRVVGLDDNGGKRWSGGGAPASAAGAWPEGGLVVGRRNGLVECFF